MLKALQNKASFLFPLFCVAALLFSGCQKSTGDQSAGEQSASDEIDFGTITNSFYQNHYFGLTVPIPGDWSVQDQKEQDQLIKKGGQMMYGDDKSKQALLKAAQLQTVHLFAVFEYPPGSPVPFNPSILSMAENVQELPGIKRGADYLYHVKKALASSQLQISFPTNNYSTKLGGISFDVLESQTTLSQDTVTQKYYSTVIKGYALNFIVSYTTAKEEASLQKVLDGIKFQ